MKQKSEKPISESTVFRLCNVTRARGKQMLEELRIEPVAIVGRVRLHPTSVIQRLLDAASRDAVAKAN